ncbi:MAG: hypothetical protein IRZ06_05625 [Nevskia sp.]|nr:hypothetical protein [Nevskia sp.]
MRNSLLLAGLLPWSLTACGGGSGVTTAPPPPDVACPGADCPPLSISGDAPAPAGSSGSFRGFADPAIASDPAVPGRIWLAYSWPHVVPGQAPNGSAVQMAAVGTHLARSDDGGATFSFVGTLWPDVAATDPEGSGENGIISSETPSFATLSNGSTITWYGAHLRYFLEPKTGYNPKYSTSWHVRIGAAESPTALASAPETVLGVSTTADVYHPAARLDQLAGLPIQRCALLNNPALFAQNGTLYLVVECLAFNGSTLDPANSTVQVFATVPVGAPTSWTWRYVGLLANQVVASELGHATVQQPDVSLGAAGRPLLLITPADIGGSSTTTRIGTGCVALELDSIDPPVLTRKGGKLRLDARIDGSLAGACTHDRNSITGILATTQDAGGGNWVVVKSGLQP